MKYCLIDKIMVGEIPLRLRALMAGLPRSSTPLADSEKFTAITVS